MYEVRNRKGQVIGYRLTQRVQHASGEREVLCAYSNKSVRDCKIKLNRMVKEFEENKRLEKGYVFTADDPFKSYAQNWYEVYIAHSDLSPSSKKNKEQHLKNFLAEYGDYEIGSITNDDCQDFLNNLEGFSKSYVKNIRATVRAIFTKAIHQGIINDNPMEDTRLPKTTTPQKRALTPEERGLITSFAKGHEFEPEIFLLYYCGIRPKELRHLTWDGIDFENKIVTVGESKTKNGEGRKLPMPTELKRVLSKYRIKHPLGKYVFPSNHSINEPMTERMLSDKWNAFKRDLDIANGATVEGGKITKSTLAPDLTMYIFRHTFASDCQAAGIPINVAKEFMGHADISTTAQTYTHMVDDVFDVNRRRLEHMSSERINNIRKKRSTGKIIKLNK